MDQPLGRAIGNSLEIAECIEFLNGRTPEDLETVTISLAAHMIHLGGKARSIAHASKLAYEAVSKGAAADRFRQIIAAQGGDPRVMDDPGILPQARHVENLVSKKSGFVTRCDARLLGVASNALGAGRNRLEDPVDPAVGIHLDRKLGDRVVKGDVLCRMYWNDEKRLEDARPLIEESFEIKANPVRRRPLIHAVLKG